MYQTILTYDVIEWAYYWQVISMKKYAPSNHDISISKLKPITPIISNKDLIFITEFPRLIELYKSNFLSKKTTVVGYFSVGWGHYLDWLEKIIKVCPHIVINNYECWNKFGRRFGTTYIPNGVDLDIFKITKPINIRKPKVIWIGSTQFHRCKNYHTILLPLKQKLMKHGIDCEFISTTEQGRVFTRQQLCEWYNDATVYCCASSTEGTPNPALEAAACGCAVVSTRVGNMPELIQDGYNGYLCHTDIDDLFDKCIKAVDDVQLNYNMQNEILKWQWKDRTLDYFNYFDSCIKEDRC